MAEEKTVVYSVDCGGTNLRVAAMDEKMNILAVHRGPTVVDDPEKLYETIRSLLLSVKEECGYPIRSIGMSICGIVVHNAVGRCGNLGFDSFDFASRFARDFPDAKLHIANDANCSALVESMYGATKGLIDSAFVTISSGIGLGVVINGSMVDLPMEGGRLLTRYKGKTYETEYLLSGNGIVRLAAIEGLKVASGAEFFSLVRKKAPEAVRVYGIWLDLLSTWFANLQLLFDCEAYALSGGVMKSSDVFLAELEKLSNAKIAQWNLRPIVLKDAKYKQDVGLAAGACLALRELGK